MEEINLEDLFNYFKRNVLLIISVVVIFLVAVIMYIIFIKVSLYKSSTTLILTTDSSSSSYDSITTTDITLNQSLVGTYTEIIKSKKVLNQVIENLSLDLSYTELYGQVSVSNVTDTEMLKVEIENEDSALSAAIANEIASVFLVDIVEIYSIENISIIDEAEISETPSNNNDVTQIALGALVGLFVSSGIIFLVYYFDRRVKTKEEIEKITGLPVLGVVPISKEMY